MKYLKSIFLACKQKFTVNHGGMPILYVMLYIITTKWSKQNATNTQFIQSENKTKGNEIGLKSYNL